MKTFKSVEPSPGVGEQFSSLVHPFQTFQWADYSAKPDRDYTYEVVPMYGDPGALRQGNAVSVDVHTEPVRQRSTPCSSIAAPLRRRNMPGASRTDGPQPSGRPPTSGSRAAWKRAFSISLRAQRTRPGALRGPSTSSNGRRCWMRSARHGAARSTSRSSSTTSRAAVPTRPTRTPSRRRGSEESAFLAPTGSSCTTSSWCCYVTTSRRRCCSVRPILRRTASSATRIACTSPRMRQRPRPISTTSSNSATIRRSTGRTASIAPGLPSTRLRPSTCRRTRWRRCSRRAPGSPRSTGTRRWPPMRSLLSA